MAEQKRKDSQVIRNAEGDSGTHSHIRVSISDPSLRAGWLRRLKRLVGRGSYPPPDALSDAVDRLIDDAELS